MEIVLVTMELAMCCDIPKDIYDLIQAFFNHIYISKQDAWDAHWINDKKGTMKKLFENALRALIARMKTLVKTDEIKQTITILMKFCMMIYYNYQQAIKTLGISDNIDDESTRFALMEQIFEILQKNDAVFSINDEHLALLFYRFFHKDDGFNGRNEGIVRVLRFVAYFFN